MQDNVNLVNAELIDSDHMSEQPTIARLVSVARDAKNYLNFLFSSKKTKIHSIRSG